jgi:hypothetical protein
LETLKSEIVDLKKLSEREKLVTDICRNIIAKVKRFLHLKEEKGKKQPEEESKKRKKVELCQ